MSLTEVMYKTYDFTGKMAETLESYAGTGKERDALRNLVKVSGEKPPAEQDTRIIEALGLRSLHPERFSC